MPSVAQPAAPLIDVPRNAEAAFRLWFYAAVLRVISAAVARAGSWEALFDRFPFLAHYNNELARGGVDGVEASDAHGHWIKAVLDWEPSVEGHLPLRALRAAAALDPDAIVLLLTLGLTDEDPRFTGVFEFLQGQSGAHRPVAGVLATWWDASSNRAPARVQLRRLEDAGLIEPLDAEAPRSERTYQVPLALWDAARGVAPEEPVGGATHVSCDRLLSLDRLILDADLRRRVEQLVPLLRTSECDAVVIRGPRRNGRAALAAAIAAALGRGVITVGPGANLKDERGRALGALATLLHAMPIVRLDLSPGESVDLARLRACDSPVGVVLGRHGGVTGAAVDRAITLVVEPPDAEARAEHWRTATGDRADDNLAEIADRFRLTSGHIRKAARLASARAALDGRPSIEIADVQDAVRSLNRQALDTLATPVPATTSWAHVALTPHTRCELGDLERRCRQRERLLGVVGAALSSQLTCSVRALLSGPSGCGKSLVARALATALHMDLYRLEVAGVLNKYIGETEKNVNEVFTRAEELDVMLLVDEGEGLLSTRTAVASSTDKYSNVLTDFLLARLESYEGILLITTNAAERIDPAFQRRMDVVIDFRPPDAPERLAIWDLHLPREHAVPYEVLADIATRCAITGGQIRNAVLHACSLALDERRPVSNSHVRAAIEREYRKAGAVSPLGRAGAPAYGG